jgi:hypothetical protein
MLKVIYLGFRNIGNFDFVLQHSLGKSTERNLDLFQRKFSVMQL